VGVEPGTMHNAQMLDRKVENKIENKKAEEINDENVLQKCNKCP